LALKPLGIAVVGMGFGGRVQLPVFHAHPGTTVRSICSGTRQRAERAATEFGIEHFTDNFHEAIDRPDIDVVSVATPPHLHLPVALAALEIGKHVLCEKPFALNVRDARRMVAAAKRVKRAGMLDHEFRWIPARYRLKELVDKGWAGDVQRILIAETSTWMAKGSTLRYAWQSQKKLGGGLLGAIGSHFIDFCRWVGGGDVRSAGAELETVVKKRQRDDGSFGDVDADDNVSLRMRIGKGVSACVNLCATTNAQLSSIYVLGSNGVLHIRGGELYGVRAGRDPVPVTAPAKYPAKQFEGGHYLMGPFYALVTEMIKRVRGEPSEVPTFEDGLRVQEVIDAARQSSRSGRTIALPRTRAKA